MLLGTPALPVSEPSGSRSREFIAPSLLISPGHTHSLKQPDGSAVIGAEEFQYVREGSILINTSRGGVIDEAALIENLNSGKVRAACLDVFVGEPNANPSILSHPSIIATPHIGASTVEAQERIGLEIAENVRRIIGM